MATMGTLVFSVYQLNVSGIGTQPVSSPLWIWFQVGTNLVNDACDFERGAVSSPNPTPSRHRGPTAAKGNPTLTCLIGMMASSYTDDAILHNAEVSTYRVRLTSCRTHRRGYSVHAQYTGQGYSASHSRLYAVYRR
eukprot:8568308-Pyramimonas_sp.AAC.1